MIILFFGQSLYLKAGFDGWWEDDDKFRGLENGHKLFPKFVFGLICIWVLLACIFWKNTFFLGTPKNSNSPLKLQGQSYKGGLWFFVRLLKQSLGEVDTCCLFVFIFVKWGDNVKNIGLCDLCALRDLGHSMWTRTWVPMEV